jgi:hypothetical protein
MGRSRMATAYWREISGVLALKLVGLIILYSLFFGPSSRPEMSPARVAAHLGQGGGQP